MDNTTISGNSAALGGGALAFDLAESGNAAFNFSTIVNNTTSTPGQGGGILAVSTLPDDQFVLFGTSIVAGNTAAGSPSNCAGPGNFQGSASIESTNTCGFTGTSMVNTDPQIAPLATYPGGELTTRTHGLYDTSPAANFFAASLGSCSGYTLDQRYAPRPAGSGCDVGAHEGTVGANPNPPGGGPAIPAPTTPAPATKCKKKKKKKKGKSLASAAKKKKKGCKKRKKKQRK